MCGCRPDRGALSQGTDAEGDALGGRASGGTSEKGCHCHHCSMMERYGEAQAMGIGKGIAQREPTASSYVFPAERGEAATTFN